MAIVHQATLHPDKVTMVSRWIGDQRWYTGKGRTPELRKVGAFRFDDPAGEVGIETLFLVDEAGRDPVVYQVPLTYRHAPLEGLADHAFLGTMEHSVLGTRYVYDACHDPVYATELLRTIVNGATEAERSDGLVEGTCGGSGIVGAVPRQYDVAMRSPQVLIGEQSNTSIIGRLIVDGEEHDIITKVFRVVHEGRNADVEVQGSLTAAGSDRVPELVGWLSGSWQDSGAGQCGGDLAFAQRFFPDAQDGWRQAVSAAESGKDFSAQAHALGVATAEIHAQLATFLPTAAPQPERIRAIAAELRARFATAADADPTLASHQEEAEAIYTELENANWPTLQRIHGDLHLGQALDTKETGWVLIDFEGEPLRAPGDRAAPDAPARDIAGLLRSFDYAAGSIAAHGPTDTAAWSSGARAAFLAGYSESSGLDVQGQAALLRAYELDKAAYELVYETRNRPDWVEIPRTALTRLLSDDPYGDNAAGPDHSTEGDDVRIPLPGRAQPREEKPIAELPKNSNSSGPQPVSLDRSEADLVLRGLHRGPHSVLGVHPGEAGTTVRVLRPLAASVSLDLGESGRVDLQHEYEGIWSGVVPGTDIPDYRVVTTYEDGVEHIVDDPYRFLPTMGEVDLHLIGEGRHEQLWTVLGAHMRTYPSVLGEVRGTSFAVWAPHARAIQVIGDFNRWDGGGHSLRVLGSSGVWELFVPGVEPGSAYKFNILCADGVWRQKADPMARQAQVAPQTASVVTDSAYDWNDEDWLSQRAQQDPAKRPMSTYEVHLGSWRQGHSYADLAEHLVNYVQDLGFTHVELMPVMDHPYPPSWGYHVTSYYAPNSRFGDPDGFRYLVDTLHQNGIGVILDWVPGHFATDPWALARFDGTPLYEHPDPRRGWHPEWGSYIFDFGRPHVRNFLVANALYWMEEFHIDGLRIDGVASMLYLDYAREGGEWLPNQHGGKENLEAVQLLQETNATAYKRIPGIVTIAEESTSWPGVTSPTSEGGLGFGMKWNMGWMHDSLDYLAEEPINRQWHHHKVTFGLTYAFSEKFVLPISHDEVVHGKGSLLRKMPGNRWQQLANLRAYLGFMWSHPGKQLLFMGCEFGQEAEWADGRSLDWWLLDQPAHWGVHALTKDLNRIYREHPALWELDHSSEGFTWLDADDAAGNTYAFVRQASGEDADAIVAVVNLSGSERADLPIGFPRAGRWVEVLNTDAEHYGGSGVGNLGAVEATAQEHQGQPAAATVTVGPLSTVWFAWGGEPIEDTAATKEAQL
ncbi:1,4-alpha-glucan branching protein GlgB [Demetria terragena]|uniref:1,4-alpha-glucan branching protein GlgB n=1 Tax=Demetria terragena TaxID=63959 RepID=UPI000378A653|nr:1,4-alpha-glucan branching protein GlgB [Demetria terragena]